MKRWVLRRDLNVSLEGEFLRFRGKEFHSCGLQKEKARSDMADVDMGCERRDPLDDRRARSGEYRVMSSLR